MEYRLTIVVPVYNEEDNVIPLCEKEYEALEGIDYELILVDDGSSDKTVEKLTYHSSFGNV